MAYTGIDKEIYESGTHFRPLQEYTQQQWTPPEIMGQNTTTGITNTQAAVPYIWPPQGGGGGGGGGGGLGLFGDLNPDTLKPISSGKYVEKAGPANMYGGNYVTTDRDIAQTEGGIWKDVKTGQNVYHANLPQIKGVAGTIMDFITGKKKNRDIYEGTWTGAEWDDEFDPTIADKQLNTYQRWKAKKAFKAEQAKAAADKVAEQQAAVKASGADVGHYDPGAGGASHLTRGRDQGGLGLTQSQAESVSQANKDAGYSSWGGLAEGGRIGYRNGEFVDENINVEGPNFDFNENIEMAEGEITAEQKAMVLDMLEKGMDLPTIISITGVEEADILGLMEGETAMAEGEGIASIV